MIFAELPLAEARGAMLAHAVELGGKRWPKGCLIDAALEAAAAAFGVQKLWAARLEAGDIPEDIAAQRIAKLFAGSNVEIRAPANGRVNLHAGANGLLMLDPDRITAANRLTDAIGIATRPPFTPVQAGDLLATVKIIPFGLSSHLLDRLAGNNSGGISILPWRQGLAACLIQTSRPGLQDKMLQKTARITGERLARLGVSFTEIAAVPHRVDELAVALSAVDVPLVLVAGATATSDVRDVVPAAILQAGGEVLRVGMPVDPGNLLVLGKIADNLVIGLPGCARSPQRNGLDLVLERWAAGIEPCSADIAAMGVGGILEEGGRPVPWGWSG